MSRPVCCLDTSILVKALVPEEGSAEAAVLLRRVVSGGYRLVAPSFAWAEVGTVLMKKVRAGLLTREEADLTWKRFSSLAIEYIGDDGGNGRGQDGGDESLPQATWEIAFRLRLPVMYDAAFLAAAELAAKCSGSAVEFWTADRELVNALGDAVPPYVRLLPGLG